MDSQEYHIEAQQADHWWFRGRRQLLKSIIDDFAKRNHVQKFNSIVDVGCGVGLNADVLRDYTDNLIGVDPDDVAVGYCQKKGHDKVIKSSLEELTLDKIQQQSEVVIAMDILEHLPDDLLGFEKIFQLLSLGGIAIITVPAFPALHGLQDVVGRHYRRYRRKRLLNLCQEAKLEIIRSTYFNTWFFAPIALVRYALRIWKPASLQSENQFNFSVVNGFLSHIFAWGISSIAYGMNYPFGVSLLLVAKKTKD